MKRIVIGAAALALVVPSTALAQDPAPSPEKNASKTCKALKAAMGETNFKNAYGTNKTKSNAHGKCVSKQVKVEKAAVSKAKSACKAEQSDPNFAAAHGGKTFEQFYGTNKNGKNAYGKCVSGKAKAANDAETKTKVNAARTCKAERKSLGAEEFTKKYGGKRNAFGKCVSQTAKAKS